MKLAVIDVGTRSVKLLLAEVANSKIYVLEYLRKPAILGEQIDRDNTLSQAAIREAAKIITDFYHVATTKRVDSYAIIGTSLLRKATNAGDFIQEIESRVGVTFEIISGRQEAELLSIVPATVFRGHTMIVGKVGGGSTELAFWKSDELVDLLSIEVGGIAFTKELSNNQSARSDKRHFSPLIRERVKSFGRGKDAKLLVGVGAGLFLTAQVNNVISGNPTKRIHLTSITLDDFRKVQDHIDTTSPQALSEKSEISIRDAKFLSGVVAIAIVVMEELGFTSMTFCNSDIAHGKAIQIARRLLGAKTRLDIELSE